MTDMIKTFKERQNYMFSICEEIGFAQIKTKYTLEELELIGNIPTMEKKSSNGVFLIFPSHSYKFTSSFGVVLTHRGTYDGIRVLIEDPFEFNSNDIQFICDSLEELTIKIKYPIQLVLYNVHMLIKRKNKNRMHTVKRKQGADKSVTIKLNVGRRICKIQLEGVGDTLG